MTLYNKNNIYDVCVDGTFVTFLYKGTCQEAANLRNCIKYNIHSYLINKITFHQKQFKHEKTLEYLSLCIGQLVLNNDGVNDDSKGTLNITGPIMVTANHIQGLSFVYDSPIVYLNTGQTLSCDLYVEKNCAKANEKWNPVSCITFSDYDLDIFKFRFELVGMINMDGILEQL